MIRKYGKLMMGWMLIPLVIAGCGNNGGAPGEPQKSPSAPPLSSAEKAAAPASADTPQTILLDARTMAAIKQELKDNAGTRYIPALNILREDANKALQTAPLSVMDKTGTPPSGDKHDYMSMAPYWWPDPNKPDGKPYIQQDGKTNPEGATNRYDKSNMGKMASSVTALSLAYYFTDNEPYAEHAAKMLRTWFLDPATRMNPNMNYGQSVLGRADGRKEGVLESQVLLDLVDDDALLRRSKNWSDQDHAAFMSWIAEYLKWLKSNKLALDERKASNNHGTWYDAIFVGLTVASGDKDGAAAYMKTMTTKRIASQIDPDGKMPQEMSRTRSLHYPLYNLKPFTMLAILGEQIGVDLWGYSTADGRSIHQAYNFLAPYLNGKPWPNAQIREENESAFSRYLRIAAIKYNDPTYAQAADHLLGKDKVTSRVNLIAPLPQFQ